MPPEVQLLRPERAAHATIRGFLYQTCLGVLRWLELGPEEILVCEGDEDLDRLIRDGGGISEQVKAYSGSLGIGDRAVADSLRNFLLAYVALRRQGTARRFRFVTTAELRGPRRGDRGLDVLRAWKDGERGTRLIAAVRALLADHDSPAAVRGAAKKRKARTEVEECLAWLDAEPGGWTGFLDAVEWSFDAPNLPVIRQEISNRLASRADARALPADLLGDRLLAELLEASSRKEVGERVRSAADLDHLLATTGAELSTWAASPAAVKIRTVLDELDKLDRLLHDNSADLPPDPGPAKLLTAAYEVVPFEVDGRRTELDLLEAWCHGADRRSVLLLTGAGGSGKTRLLIEWCRRLRRRGWHAGFLRPDRGGARDLDPLLEGIASRLVVIDYAETRLAVVRSLLLMMGLEDQGRGPKVRLVLLARNAGDWWDRLYRSPERAIEDLLLRSPQPAVITPLIEDERGRRRAFAVAVEAFAEQLAVPVPESLPPPDLQSGEGLDRALYFHMAALAALRGERIATVRDALKQTLRHERQFWQGQVAELRLDGPLSEAMLESLEPSVAAMTLAGGADDWSQARSLIERVLQGSLPPYLLDAMVRLVRHLYGGTGGGAGRWLGPLQPDVLGEELVAECLARDENLLGRLLATAETAQAHAALTVMTRLARRSPDTSIWLRQLLVAHLAALAEVALDVAMETGDPAGLELAEALEDAVTDDIAERLYGLLGGAGRYRGSVPLREVQVVVARKIVKLRRRSASTDDAFRPDLGMSLNNLSNGLSELGRREEALAAIEESVGLYRGLAASRPDAFRSDLAMSLNNLSNGLSELGRREEALAAIEESVGLYRMLAASRPDAFRPDLAMSLNNLSNRLSDLGRWEEALAAIEESVGLYRMLAASRPDAFRPDLAMSLNNLSNRLSDFGRREEALAAIEEAVGLYRMLAASRPDAFRPDLASSLNSLSNHLSDFGRREQALVAIEEAVGLCRVLAASRPDAFRPALAMSLNNLSNRLSDLGRREEALAAIEEAVGLYRVLAASRLDAFRPDLAMSLNNLSNRLGDLGRREEALAAIEEAVGIRRALASSRPDAFRPVLASSLHNLSNRLRDLGRQNEALANAKEALGTLAPYFIAQPNTFRDRMGILAANYRDLLGQAAGRDADLDSILKLLESSG